VPYDGNDPVGLVVSLNLRRRHLSEGQRRRVSAQIENLAHGQKKVDMPIGISRADAAQMLNVSERAVARAAVVRDHGVPELQQKVAKGEVAPSTAADVARLPETEQREIVALTTTSPHCLPLPRLSLPSKLSREGRYKRIKRVQKPRIAGLPPPFVPFCSFCRRVRSYKTPFAKAETTSLRLGLPPMTLLAQRKRPAMTRASTLQCT